MKAVIAIALLALSIGSAVAQERAQLPWFKPLTAEERARLSPPYTVTKGPGYLAAVRVVKPWKNETPPGFDQVEAQPTPQSWQWLTRRGER